MSDLDVMVAMLDRAGLSHETHAPNPKYPDSHRPGTTTAVSVEDMGYRGFFSVFGFDADGRLLSVGAWE